MLIEHLTFLPFYSIHGLNCALTKQDNIPAFKKNKNSTLASPIPFFCDEKNKDCLW